MTLLSYDEQVKLINLCQTMKAQLEKTAADLQTATQTIADQRELIERLSKDNLKLVARLDQITGKKAPGTAYSA